MEIAAVRRCVRQRGPRATHGHRPGRREDGAVLVEFALVLPLLLAIVAGILDYGLYFNDAIGARQGIRQAVREGVVQTAASGTCATASGYMAQLACMSDAAVGPSTGTAYSKVFYTSWDIQHSLTVCTMVQAAAPVPIIPYPSGGWIKSRTDMSIEVTSTTPPGATSYADTLPTGASWSWCS